MERAIEPQRILFVEDNGIQRNTMRWLLASDDRVIDDCSNAEEALKLMRIVEAPYDVVVTDFHLGDGSRNGLELCQSIKRFFRGTQVILYTGWLKGVSEEGSTWFERNGFLCAFSKKEFEGLRERLDQVQQAKLSGPS